MISAATIEGLEERGLEYILGARERTDRLVREVVLADERAFTPLLVERANGAETQLFAKEVRRRRPALHRLPQRGRGREGRADRQAIVAGLEQQLRRGDKALIGNSAYRRYLRRVAAPAASPARPSRSTPASWPRRPATTASSCCAPTPAITPLQAMLRYRDLLAGGERCSARPRACCARGRSTTPPTPPSAAMSSAPSSPWCCRRSCSSAAGPRASRRNGTTCCATSTGCRRSRLAKDGQQITLRTPATGTVGPLFKAAGVALPPNIRDTAAS